MNREFLEDYKQKEINLYTKFVKRLEKGELSLKDRYPPDERFINPQKPMALTTLETAYEKNIWCQIPFCGSLILPLPPWPKEIYEKSLFKISDAQRIIDFIKDTGKIQLVLNSDPLNYEGLDYLDPFFKELNPPHYLLAPAEILGSPRDVENARHTFNALGSIRYFDWLKKSMSGARIPGFLSDLLSDSIHVYVCLKLMNSARPIVEQLENLMIDDPGKAFTFMTTCKNFITGPATDFLSDINNLSLEDIRDSKSLPIDFQPKEIQFPCEIGRFLLKKLTYAPQEMRACNELIDHYDTYDLRKVAKSLNEAIITNQPDILEVTANELSEILDNTWNDPTIPRRIKGLKIGIPLSIAAIGSVAAGPIGAVGGLLAGLGFNVLSKSITLGSNELSERVAKLRKKSYQADIYDFKEKYKTRITKNVKRK